MTMTPHFFSSLIIHIFLLAYLLSLPLYRGSITLKSLGSYFVHLESEGTTEVKPSLPHKEDGSEGVKVIAKAERFPLEKGESVPEETTRHEEKATEPQKEPEPKNVENAPQKEPLNVETEALMQLPAHKEDLKIAHSQKETHGAKKELKERHIAEIKEQTMTKPAPPEQRIEPVSVPKEVTHDKEPVNTKALPPVSADIPSTTLPATDKSVLETQPEKKVVSQERTAEKDAEAEKTKNTVKSESVREHRSDADSGEKVIPDKKGEIKNPLETEKGFNKKDEANANRAAEPRHDKTVTPLLPKREKTAHLEKGRQLAGKAPKGKLPGPNKRDMKTNASGEKNLKKSITPPTAPSVREDKSLLQTATRESAAPFDKSSTQNASQGKDRKGVATETKVKPEIKEEMRAKDKKPSAGIPVSEILLPDDLKIEIFLRDADISNVSSRLFTKAHPAADRTRETIKQKEVGVAEEDSKGGAGIKRRLRIAKADRGLYTFVIINKSRVACKADVMFHFFEKKKSERVRDFKGVELLPNAELKIKFILPEAVFWDDEEYFTGSIESSDSVTKFNNTTGITWKEEKDGGGM